MNLAIVNARMNSSRFPGKLMQPLYQDRTVLDLFLERLKKASAVDEIVVAVQDNKENWPLLEEAQKQNVQWVMIKLPLLPNGKDDVLGRTREVAGAFHANMILRVTPDCPCIHAELIHRVMVQYFMNRNGLSYTTNCWYKGFPRGMEVEAFSRESLELAWEQTGGFRPTRAHWWSGKNKKSVQDEVYYDREHVTTFIRRYPRRLGHADLPPVTGFRTDDKGQGIQVSEAFPECRLTLDYPEDLEVLRNVFAELYPKNPDFNLMDIRALWDTKRELFKANEHIRQVG